MLTFIVVNISQYMYMSDLRSVYVNYISLRLEKIPILNLQPCGFRVKLFATQAEQVTTHPPIEKVAETYMTQ